MAWLTANWFWVLVLIAFIWMHVGGHGGHGGHGAKRPRSNGKEEVADAEKLPKDPAPGGHHH